MRAGSSLALIASCALIAGCNLAFPLDGYGSGAGAASSGGSAGDGGSGGGSTSSTGGTTNSTGGTTSSSSTGGGAPTPHLYVFGGVTTGDSHATKNVWVAPIDANGSVGDFQAGPPMAVELGRYGAAATADHVYLVGGLDAGGTPVKTVQMGALGANGSYAWSQLDDFPLVAHSGRSAVTYGNHLFVMGGPNEGTEDLDIYVAQIAGDGSLSGWAKSPLQMPKQLEGTATVVDGAGILHLMGGDNDGPEDNRVWFSTLGNDGSMSPWTETLQFKDWRKFHCAVRHNQTIYMMGGDDDGVSFYDIQRADPDASGNINTWTTLALKLPLPLQLLGCTVFGDRLYIVGGMTTPGPAPVDQVHSAAFLPNGELDEWTPAPSLPTPTAGAFIVVR